MDKILKAVEDTGAEAVHPGYGFLSENTVFVGELEKAGVKFIGPHSKVLYTVSPFLNLETCPDCDVSGDCWNGR